MDLKGFEKVIYDRRVHRFYDSLLGFLLNSVYSVIGVKASRALLKNSSVPIPVVGVNSFIVLGGMQRVTNTDIVFKITEEMLQGLLQDKIPETFAVAKVTHDDPEDSRIMDADDLAHRTLIMGLFLSYYESIVDAVESRYGKKSTYQRWPAVLRFGRLVRNAFAHDGKVNITDPNASAESWRGLSYGPADNGKQILFQDLGAADVIILMEEMDREIPR